MTPSPSFGPFKKELILRRMCVVMIPPGTGDPLGAAIQALLKLGRPEDTTVKDATRWAEEAIALVRKAPGVNPYAELSDEAICEVILKRVSDRNPFDAAATKRLRSLIK